MKVVIAGGAGALGRRISARLAQRGDEVVVLTRSASTALPHRQVVWDGRTVGAWADELPGAAVINLAGALVDRRPTAANVDLLRRSRVESTTALVSAAARLERPSPVWLQGSTLAIYGDAGERELDERAPPAAGPPQMAGVARPWEDAAADANVDRLVVMRTGIVLDRGTPALDRLVGLARWGLGGRVGTGRQWVSWIHVDDFLAVVETLLDDHCFHGVVHVTSPNPVRNGADGRAPQGPASASSSTDPGRARAAGSGGPPHRPGARPDGTTLRPGTAPGVRIPVWLPGTGISTGGSLGTAACHEPDQMVRPVRSVRLDGPRPSLGWGR